MISAINDDEIINRVGGRFKLTALIQKRWVQLMQGERPMVDPAGLSDIEIVIKEIVEGKIEPVLVGPDDVEPDEDA